MNITCSICGQVIATRSDASIIIKGQNVPTEHLDGVILKCSGCKRSKTYYFKDDKQSVNTDVYAKPQDIVQF